ncbi:MAG: ATP-binding cassette domain-containing protein [Candidatus Nanopelagicales bacterium]
MGSVNAIELDGVSVARGDRVVWSDGTFAVEPGSFVAVIGPNGSGKTTLLQLVLGLLPTRTGEVRVLGSVPARGNAQIGYVPQSYGTVNGDLVRTRDLVRMGLDGGRWGMGRPSAEDRRRVDAALEAVGAQSFANRRVSQLSGGQQQRVAIAQAIVGSPRILLLDEPLANLDIKTQREIVDLLGVLRERLDLTILVVVHDLNPLLPQLTGAIYLLDGHAHYAHIDDVVDEELLTHLYGTQMRVVRTPHGDLYTRSA